MVIAFLLPLTPNLAGRSRNRVRNRRVRFRVSAQHQSPDGVAVKPQTSTSRRKNYHGIPTPDTNGILYLSDLRERLIRQEETIIFALIERAQFRRNDCIYRVSAFDLPEPNISFLDFLMLHLEKSYGLVRRYTSPDEHPFTDPSRLREAVLPELDYPPTLISNDINHNDSIQKTYLGKILPQITDPGDDQNYGSSATCDVNCLQSLSKRIHYGKFVAEAKFQKDRENYIRWGLERNRQKLWDALSDKAVEEKLLARVERKARTYGREITDIGSSESFKLGPSTIREIYKNLIIPLTKEVEIDYLILRAERSKKGH